MRTLLAIALLSFACPAAAQSTQDIEALTKKEQAAREETARLERERNKVRKDVSSLKRKLAATARDARKIENELTALEDQTEALTQRAKTLRAQIQRDKAKYADLLAALQRLEAKPPPTLTLSPRNAKKAAQAGQLMATLSEQLKTRAEALGLSLIALDVTQSQITIKQGELSEARKRLSRESEQVEAGLAEKSALEANLSEERKRAAAEADRLAAESKNLLDLIAKLESEAAKVVPRVKPGARPTPQLVLPEGTKRFADAKGGMIRPVSGRVIKGYGRGEKGMTFDGRPNGQVLAPYAGRVEFSGPFKNYDKVVILNVGDGYFVLLTGLDDLYIGAGDTVRRGEPVGALPSRAGTELYIELRRNGSPVDPSPWLAAADIKSG